MRAAAGCAHAAAQCTAQCAPHAFRLISCLLETSLSVPVAHPRLPPLLLSARQGVAGLPMFFDGRTLSLIQYPPVTEQVRRLACCAVCMHMVLQLRALS